MLFHFRLTPLSEVQPWGEEGSEELHWFGLTDGEYWIEAGGEELLRYSDAASEKLGWSGYCQYYVVRLHEDLLDMLPAVLETVPERLFPYLCGPTCREWAKLATDWFERQERPSDEGYWDAVLWSDARTMDTNYLTTAPVIRIFSTHEGVTICWDNSDLEVNGIPIWQATEGTYRLSREQFIDEVRSFHQRLMAAMEQRMREVLGGALPASIRIDRARLSDEQQLRSTWLDEALARPASSTDWRTVQSAIAAIERQMLGQD